MKLKEVQSRVNFYQLLSHLYNREVTTEFYLHMRESELMKLLVEGGYFPAQMPGPDGLENFIEELACEYARIFLGPGKHLPPYESVHRDEGGKRGPLWGESTADVNRFYKYYAFDFTPNYGNIPDHISIEFEFMWRVLEEEKKALQKEELEKASQCRAVQREFLNRHIIPWVPHYCDLVIARTDNGFYRGIATLTKDFVQEEDRLLNPVSQ